MQNTNALQVFTYGVEPVRTINIDGEVWLVAKDVCDILGIANARDAVSVLDDDEKNTLRISEGIRDNSVGNSDGIQGRGNPNMNVINESGLYTLIMRSNKPEAKRFRKWVTSEVLPSIRKTGVYETKSAKGRRQESLEQALKSCKQVYTAAGFRGMKLAVALDGVLEDYLGFSALRRAGVDPDNVPPEPESQLPTWKRQILDYLKEHEIITAKDLHRTYGLRFNTARANLIRMKKQGYIQKVSYGVYTLSD